MVIFHSYVSLPEGSNRTIQKQGVSYERMGWWRAAVSENGDVSDNGGSGE